MCMSDMENIEDGISQPAIVNEKEESSASANQLSDGKIYPPAHHHHHPPDVIRRDETGCRCGRSDLCSCEAVETDHCAVGCSASTRCARAARGGTKMLDLDLVTESSVSPTCTVKNHVASDGICRDCSGSALSRPVKTGSISETPGGPSAPCSAADELDGDNLSFLSNADRTTIPDKNSSAVDLDVMTFEGTSSHMIESERHSCDRQHREQSTTHSCCLGGLNIPNGDCIQGPAEANLGTQTCNCCTGTVGKETKLLNGGLILGESSCSGTWHPNPTSPLHLGGEVVGCLSHSQKPSSLSGTERHSQGSPQTTTEEELHSGVVGARCRTQQNTTEPQLGTPCSSDLTSQGIKPPSSPNPNSEPGQAPVSPSIQEASNLSHLGLSYTLTPGPRSLPCSVSYDAAPLSPGPRLEAGPDEAFGDTQPCHQQCDHRFMDVSLGSRNTYECSRRQSAPGHLPQGGFSVGETSDLALQSKRPGIAEYFGRGLFTRKQREASQSAPGWKLFGKVPLRESPTKDSKTIKQESGPGGLSSLSTPDLLNSGEYESRQGRTTAGNSPTQHALGRSRKNLDFEPLSTTALILEDRPANLPAKSVEEAQRHRQQYDEMVAGAKKRELKEAQKKVRQMKERFKQEESISNAMIIWNNDILPNWDTMRSSRRARELWWQGLPPNVRGKVWSLAIGNELNITPELYGIFLSRAKEKWRSFSETGSESEADDGASQADRESSLELIKLDISRTFPSLFIFQKGGPYHDLLHSVLGAYTCYRPDVGYVQGMSFIAAVLILNLEEAEAFISFANLLNKPCQMAFFRVDHELMLKYFAAFEVFFEENLPRLFSHFQTSNLTPDLYLIDWIFSLYTKSLPLDVACRVWDVFCRDGEEFLFRTGLGILRLYEDVLLQMDFIHIAQFLARLPDEELLSDRLFSCIAATPMISGNRKWSQVFSSLIKDNRETDKSISPALKS